MADEPAAAAAEPIAIPAEPVVPEPAGAAAGEAAAPAAAVATDAAPAVTAEPAAAAVDAAAAAKPDIKPHTDEPTLLEGAAKPEDAAKPGDDPAKPTEPVKPVDGAEPPAAIAEPVAYDFTLPEGFAADGERMGAYTGLLAEHKIAPEVGQKLLDLYTQEASAFRDQLYADQHRVFGETRKGWRDRVLADEELGGAGHQTAMAVVARTRDLFVPKAEIEAFGEFLRVTGAGDHPAFLKFLYRVGQKFDEPPGQTPNPAPPPDRGGARPGRGSFYDHPTSRK